MKVSGLSHKRADKSDPMFYWFMFHNIYCIYSYTKSKEERNYDVMLTSMP